MVSSNYSEEELKEMLRTAKKHWEKSLESRKVIALERIADRLDKGVGVLQ